jgi:hypothetical protein
VAGVIAAFALALLGTLALIQPVGASQPPWAKLHRPLHLPQLAPGAVCPVSRIDGRIAWKRLNIFGGSGIGRGPVYPGLGGSRGHLDTLPDDQYGGRWAGGKVFWYVRRTYRGRVLIRGRRLDGPQSLGFNGRRLPTRELRIEPYDSVSWEGSSSSLSRLLSLGAAVCARAQLDERQGVS